LGWLSLRPFSTYELAQQMRRNLRFFWPRAESQLYEEPKNLVAHRLARAERTKVGQRPRTTYSITSKGRRALAAWMATTAVGPSLEFDALVRVFFGTSATPRDLLAAVAAARSVAAEIQARGREVANEYLEGRAPLPERVHMSGLAFDFLWGHAENLLRWTEASTAELERWKDCAPDDRKAARARRVFEEALGRRRR
jgi:DNA-binding PadR family transcriptional regulator